MKFRPKKSARQNAARVLPRLAAKFFRAGDASVDDDLRASEVHDFRIRTKRFRYVLEYFRPCYGQALEGYLEVVRGVQSVLGELNDCRSTRILLDRLLEPGDPPARHKKLFAAMARRESGLLEKYRSYWRENVANPESRERFVRYLSHPPRDRLKRVPAEEEPADAA